MVVIKCVNFRNEVGICRNEFLNSKKKYFETKKLQHIRFLGFQYSNTLQIKLFRF